MYEPEAESDEDCEVYFLKPVNEYNIVDKIKEANKVLFALDDDDEDGDGPAAGNSNVSSSNRKVTFAPNLENYEPTSQQTEQEQEQQIPSPPDELLQQLAQLKLRPDRERFEPIAEEPVKEQEKAVEKPLEQQPELIEKQDEVDEEICEEILELTEVDSNKQAQATAPASIDYEEDDDFSGVDEDDLTAERETLVNDPQRQRISRQNTFDYNYEQTEGESDQRSLTNLLTESDCEEDERAVNEARLKLRQAYKSLYKTMDANEQAQINRLTSNGNEEVEDDDDDLSIIAASYIPDDFELNERSIYYKKEEETQQERLGTTSPNNSHSHSHSLCNSNSNSNTISSTSTKTFFNARRFSFRRRGRPTPSVQPEIKMNYKICCEHRNALQDKLPRYTGYMSEYGLSVKQLQQRDQQLRRKQRFSMEQH